MIEYDRLLEIAKKMHCWIFLHSVDEYEAYDEIGLTDEENAELGSIGTFVLSGERKADEGNSNEGCGEERITDETD